MQMGISMKANLKMGFRKAKGRLRTLMVMFTLGILRMECQMVKEKLFKLLESKYKVSLKTVSQSYSK